MSNSLFKKITLLSPVVFATLPVTVLAEESNTETQKVEEVTVITASRTETPLEQVAVDITVLDQEAIEAKGYPMLQDLFRTQRSISVTNTGGLGKASSLRIRGEEGHRTKVLIDGIDIADMTGTQVSPAVQHLSSTGINSVEILRGPQGFAYGADAGGVINIVTGSDKPGSFLTLGTGAYATNSLSAGTFQQSLNGEFFISFSQLDSEGFNAQTADESGERDGYSNTTFHSKGNIFLTDTLELNLVARSMTSTSEFDGCWTSVANDCVGENDQQIFKLGITSEGEVVNQNISVSNAQIERENFGDGVSSYQTEGYVNGLTYQGNARVNSMLAASFGFDVEEEAVDPQAGDKELRTQSGVYSEIRANLNDMWFVTVGPRIDFHEDFGRHESFRVSSAMLMPVSSVHQLKLRASYGTGFRAPSLFESTFNEANGAGKLNEEKSKGFDLGVEFTTANKAQMTLGYFDQTVTDEIVYDGSINGYGQDDGDTTSRGVELGYYLPVGTFMTLSGNYTYNETETAEHEQRRRRPEHLQNWGFAVHNQNKTTQLNLNIRSASDATDQVGWGDSAETVDLDDYQVVDLNFIHWVASDLKTSVRVENLFDEDYEEVGGYNTSRSAVYGNIHYTF